MSRTSPEPSSRVSSYLSRRTTYIASDPDTTALARTIVTSVPTELHADKSTHRSGYMSLESADLQDS
jgi:hypothetical protein